MGLNCIATLLNYDSIEQLARVAVTLQHSSPPLSCEDPLGSWSIVVDWMMFLSLNTSMKSPFLLLLWSPDILYLDQSYFPNKITKKCLDVELGHLSARVSMIEVTHGLLHATSNSKIARPYSRDWLCRFRTCPLLQEIGNTSRNDATRRCTLEVIPVLARPPKILMDLMERWNE